MPHLDSHLVQIIDFDSEVDIGAGPHDAITLSGLNLVADTVYGFHLSYTTPATFTSAHFVELIPNGGASTTINSLGTILDWSGGPSENHVSANSGRITDCSSSNAGNTTPNVQSGDVHGEFVIDEYGVFRLHCLGGGGASSDQTPSTNTLYQFRTSSRNVLAPITSLKIDPSVSNVFAKLKFKLWEI